jgi:uncharacterized repeat protein (TIGR03803 family)
MKRLCKLIGACTSAAIVAACGGSNNGFPSLTPLSVAQRIGVRKSSAGVIYSFKGGTGDGSAPEAGLLDDKDALYSTTREGGEYCESGSYDGCGTIFAITTSGKETVLHSFRGRPGDGADPFAGLINVNGTLYGTTGEGGAYDAGTVFSITTSGRETVLYSFKGGSADGEIPEAGLLNVKGTLYGTTANGGSGFCLRGKSDVGCGTVFSITTSGAETVLYSFKGHSGDGANPFAGLVNVKGTLYGTTWSGGERRCYKHASCGTVFAVTTSGKETMIYRFKGGPGDGEHPSAGLINVNGTLYGTTLEGGELGCGTIFAMTTSGKETRLYSFKGEPADGARPPASLLNFNGTLYGTTALGGANDAGTVFSVTTSGTETVLYSFTGGGDGTEPYAGLTQVDGTLYGTTVGGGAYFVGTVFSLSP